MKAITLSKYGSPNSLQLEDIPQPKPQDDEVLVKVRAASVNDWDWGLVRGKPFYIRLFCGLFKPKVLIPGVDISGEVEAVGKDVTKFRPGDAVYGDLSECGFGGFAEYVCAPEHALALKPESLAFAEAAAIPHAAMLAVQALIDEGHIEKDQKVLINGAGGGVGTLGVQIAKSKGVKDITGVDAAGKLDMMLKAGFEKVIDYTREDFTKTGERYDLILDAKTTRSVFDYARALKPGGAYVTVGGYSNRLLEVFFLGALLNKFGKKTFCVVALKPNKDLDYINGLYKAGKLRPVIDGPYPLRKVPEAIQLLGNGNHKGKIIITLNDD